MQVISKNSSSHIFTVETLTLLIWLTGDAFNSEKITLWVATLKRIHLLSTI